MKASRPGAALAVALAAYTAGSAPAQDAQGGQALFGAAPQVHEARTATAAHPGHPHAAPAAAPAPKNKPPPRRRSVQQIIATVPPPQLAGPSYGPTLYSRAPTPGSATAPGAGALYPPPAVVLGACQGGVCTDAAGTTYNLGAGNAGVSSQGRLCSRSGQTVQCF